MTCRILLLPTLLAALFTSTVPARDFRVILPATDVDRAGQVVALPLPSGAPRFPVLRDTRGITLPLQPGSDGILRFIVPWQAAGEILVYTLGEGRSSHAAGVSVFRQNGDLQIAVRDEPVFHYRIDKTILPRADLDPVIARAGYLHPLFSPSGKVVTDDYPTNHAHHHGIWAPWTRTAFQGRSPDFWNMQTGTGAEHFVEIVRTWAGPVHGGFESKHEMIDLSAVEPVKALDVMWRATAYALEAVRAPARIFDLDITQTCATTDAVLLPEYHYGGFGLRGAATWNGPGQAARFLTSTGISDRIQGNMTRAHWCYLGGPFGDGGFAGTAALGHPENVRAPQPVRLHPDMPYFSFVPQQLGAFTLEPGRPYTVRFRFVITDDEPNPALLEAYWQGYARPAVPVFEAL